MDQEPPSFIQETASGLHRDRNLADERSNNDNYNNNDSFNCVASSERHGAPELLLPIALFAALAMASTAATAYFAYATLLCQNAQHCKGGETIRFVRLVAGAICISNLLGLFALGYLQKLVTTNRKRGLMLWILCRSLSAVTLMIGVSVNNVYIALSGRVFEGLASDNLLHFTLNAVYTQSETPQQMSSLINHSLALYMIGISVSPFAVGLLEDFTISCVIALALFAMSFVYLHLCIAGPPCPCTLLADANKRDPEATTPINSPHQTQAFDGTEDRTLLRSWLGTALSPLQLFYQRPARLLVGFSLFAYNTVQSYIFTALLVHTSLHFGFTGRENGFIISIASLVGSAYIFMSVSLVPRAMRYLRGRRTSITLLLPPRSPSNGDQESGLLSPKGQNILLALFSLLLQTISLAVLAFATRTWHIYILTIPLAIGLSSSSFMKATFVGRFHSAERPAALAALAMMETLGSVCGPVVLGTLQSLGSGADKGTVFFGAMVILITAAASFAAGPVPRIYGQCLVG